MDADYKKFCMKCGWNYSDYGCISPPGEEVYQCPMYMYYHPQEVEKFNKDMKEWESMITILKLIKNHNRVETLEIMLQVIDILEKNYSNDDTMDIKDWEIVYKHLRKSYCELKYILIEERKKEEKHEKQQLN